MRPASEAAWRVLILCCRLHEILRSSAAARAWRDADVDRMRDDRTPAASVIGSAKASPRSAGNAQRQPSHFDLVGSNQHHRPADNSKHRSHPDLSKPNCPNGGMRDTRRAGAAWNSKPGQRYVGEKEESGFVYRPTSVGACEGQSFRLRRLCS